MVAVRWHANVFDGGGIFIKPITSEIRKCPGIQKWSLGLSCRDKVIRVTCTESARLRDDKIDKLAFFSFFAFNTEKIINFKVAICWITVEYKSPTSRIK